MTVEVHLINTLNEYQSEAKKTAIFDEKHIPALAYCGLKLNGEVGEVAELIGKMYRDNGGDMTGERRRKLLYELGDVLWYLTIIADLLNYDLDTVAFYNIKKIRERQERGTLKGEGSER
jgi:NTP pyrophosphatase (non-canonical NTP hydrolase)